MARDRKRAKQRRERSSGAGGSVQPAQGSDSGQVGIDAPAIPDEHAPVEASLSAATESPITQDGPSADPFGGAGGESEAAAASAFGTDPQAEPQAERASASAHPAAPARRTGQSLSARSSAFLRASWAELQRMQWPDRQQTTQATAVVLGFVIVAGIYLGLADLVAQKIVNAII